MNIVDQMTVLSVYKEIEDELSLAVSIENTLPLPLCSLVHIHSTNPTDLKVCLDYLHEQRPTAHINSEFIRGRYHSDAEFWWPRYDYDRNWERINNEDFVLDSNRQRLEFIRHLIDKVEKMSLSINH